MKRIFATRGRTLLASMPLFASVFTAARLGAGTVAWYHFDEVAPGAPVTSDVRFLNAVNSAKLPGAPYSVGEYGTKKYDVLGSAAAFMPVATNNIDDTMYVIDPVSGTKNETGRSLYFTYADDDTNNLPARYGGCVQVASDSSLSLSAVTVEFFVFPVRLTSRTNNGYQLVAKQSTGTGTFTYSICLTSGGKPYVNVYDSSGARMETTTGPGIFESSTSILDGKWHHIALTVDGDAAKLYVDYKLQKTVKLTESSLYYVDDAPLYIGASQMGYYKPGGFIDEVRISNTVLEPLQFLRYADTADTQFHAGFEGSFNADVPHLIDPGVGIGTAGRIVPEMSLPAFTNCVPGRYVVDGAGDSMRTNALSVLLEGGYIKYPHNTELEMPEMTVECFMKHHASSNYAGILRFSKSNLDVTDPIWFVGVQNGQLFMRIDTATKENAGKLFGATFLDGRWHHLGVTFSTNGLGQAVVRVYDNYRQVGTDWTLDGPLDFSQGSVLHVGRSSYTGYLFYGCVDEVRISRGVLDPEEFLHVFNGGLNVILR